MPYMSQSKSPMDALTDFYYIRRVHVHESARSGWQDRGGGPGAHRRVCKGRVDGEGGCLVSPRPSFDYIEGNRGRSGGMARK